MRAFSPKGAVMWFKNLSIYRFTKPFDLTPEQLEEKLAAGAFQPCGKLQPFSIGWVSPLGADHPRFVHSTGHYHMVCLRKQERVIPSAVVREAMEERIAALQAESGRKLRSKERAALRDEILLDLLPRAFTRSSIRFAYLAPKDNLVVVDSASPKGAEELIGQLRVQLGSLPVEPLAPATAANTIFTRWVQGESVPSDVKLGDECELRDLSEDGAIARCKRQALDADEVQGHLESGKRTVKLAIDWADTLTCILDETLTVKRVRFSDRVLEGNDNGNEDPVALFDADFVLMTTELARFIRRIEEIFGAPTQTEKPSNVSNAKASRQIETV